MSAIPSRSKRNLDAYVKALQDENSKLRQTLIFIADGLKRGTIKSQLIMTCIPDAKEWTMQTLEEIIGEALGSKKRRKAGG